MTAAAAAVLVALDGLGAVLAVQRGANRTLAARNADLARANTNLREAIGQKDAANTALGEANERVQARFELAPRGDPVIQAGGRRRGGAEGGPAAAAAGQAARVGPAVLRQAGRPAQGPDRRRVEGGAGRVICGAWRVDQQDRPEA